eukprot:TRINITY_DN4610_c0_g1_i3.p1 TRINITY_DN4610_c0_g1~~TRINITY_DN4610_c0_g1_i3.p1  ORF type:complete len:159 (+),score=22.20 TRINITY_DN4610_c0_g1_i3:141-617(+)
MSDFYSLRANTIEGNELAFESLRGKLVLIVNVASQCGFTPQYKLLQDLYNKYHDQGLEILGFPCNQFGEQEPGSPTEISDFCTRKYSVTFQIMEKTEVNGVGTHPVYEWLKSQKSQLGMTRIKWNFEKFLVSREGEVVERWSSVGTALEGKIVELLGN